MTNGTDKPRLLLVDDEPVKGAKAVAIERLHALLC